MATKKAVPTFLVRGRVVKDVYVNVPADTLEAAVELGKALKFGDFDNPDEVIDFTYKVTAVESPYEDIEGL